MSKPKMIEALEHIPQYKKGSAIFTERGTTQTFIDDFCSDDSYLTIIIPKNASPQGIWDAEALNGTFIITSDTAETADIPFNYYILKGGR
jgi:hypothetical protein